MIYQQWMWFSLSRHHFLLFTSLPTEMGEAPWITCCSGRKHVKRQSETQKNLLRKKIQSKTSARKKGRKPTADIRSGSIGSICQLIWDSRKGTQGKVSQDSIFLTRLTTISSIRLHKNYVNSSKLLINLAGLNKFSHPRYSWRLKKRKYILIGIRLFVNIIKLRNFSLLPKLGNAFDFKHRIRIFENL